MQLLVSLQVPGGRKVIECGHETLRRRHGILSPKSRLTRAGGLDVASRRPDGSRVAAWAALVTGGVATIASGAVPIFHAATGVGPTSLPPDVQGGVILGCTTALIAYVYERLERSRRDAQELLDRPASGTFVYRTTGQFLEALAAATVGANEVSTINSAVPRGTLPELDRYFSKVGRYWSSRDAAGASFRSLGYVESASKAEWIVQRAYDNRKNSSTSFAIARQRSLGESTALCFHIVRKRDSYISFFYPAPDVSGSMQGACVFGLDMYEVLHRLFDRMWASAAPLASGRVLHRNGLDELLRLSPQLAHDATFQAALSASQ